MIFLLLNHSNYSDVKMKIVNNIVRISFSIAMNILVSIILHDCSFNPCSSRLIKDPPSHLSRSRFLRFIFQVHLRHFPIDHLNPQIIQWIDYSNSQITNRLLASAADFRTDYIIFTIYVQLRLHLSFFSPCMFYSSTLLSKVHVNTFLLLLSSHNRQVPDNQDRNLLSVLVIVR